MNTREQFEKETGKTWRWKGEDSTTSFSKSYIGWLEKEVERLEDVKLDLHTAICIGYALADDVDAAKMRTSNRRNKLCEISEKWELLGKENT